MKKTGEFIVHVIFFLLGLITVGCVLLISGYLVVSGIPAIREIGLWNFLFGKVWASTAAEPKFGILPFILTSVYGTAGAILLGVPVGFLTTAVASEMSYSSGLQQQALFSIALVLFLFIMLINAGLNLLLKRNKEG